jgi:hypothetical protein
MKRLMKIGKALAFASAIGMCFPGVGVRLHAADAAPQQGQKAPATLSLDVVVNANGELRGAAVNPDSAPTSKAKVSLRAVAGKENQQTSTDETGRFHFQGVRPGVYGLTVVGDKGRVEKIVRVWWQQTAPPAAAPLALVQLQNQPGEDVVRGQAPGDAGPVEGGGVSAAAVLITGAVIAGAAVGIVALAGGFSSGNGGPSSP